MNMRKHFLTVRVAKHWHRLTQEVVESPCLEIFKSRLDVVTGNKVWVALVDQGLGPDDLHRSRPTSTPPCYDFLLSRVMLPRVCVSRGKGVPVVSRSWISQRPFLPSQTRAWQKQN